MEEELVSASSSFNERGGVGDHPASLFAYHFPYYLASGMTYSQYWLEDYTLVIPYREAEKIRTQKKNQELWLQGMYVLEAIATANNKDYKYPKEPYPLDAQEQQERIERDRFNRAKAYMDTFTIKNNKRGG